MNSKDKINAMILLSSFILLMAISISSSLWWNDRVADSESATQISYNREVAIEQKEIKETPKPKEPEEVKEKIEKIIEEEPEEIVEEEVEIESSNDTITVEMTAYTAFCNTGCTGITATGLDVSNTVRYKDGRVIAVDPNVIPLHSKVRVNPSSGEPFIAYAKDTGGAIDGNKIDFLVKTKSKAYNIGRQEAEVEILRYGKGE